MSSRLAVHCCALRLVSSRPLSSGQYYSRVPSRQFSALNSITLWARRTTLSNVSCCAFVSTPNQSLPFNSNSTKQSFLATKPIQSIDHHLLRLYSSSHIKKPAVDFQIKTIRSKELIKDELKHRTEKLREKRDDFVKDMRATKHRVKERVLTRMDEIVERENVMTIPNLLCVGRAALAPYIYYVVTVQADYSYAMGLLAFAGLTDLLDGYIARNWPSQASKMGSFLDPMADKLLVGSLALSMCSAGLFPVWLCAMVLFRDVFLVGAGFVIRYISLPPPKTVSRYFDVTHATAQLEPTFISKVNTAVQLAAIATSLGAPVWNYVDHAALHGLWYFTGVTTVAAALSYVISKDTYRILKQTRMAGPKKPKKVD